MISRTNKFIFIHVPKAAGQSVTRALRPHVLPAHQMVLQRVFRTLLRHKKYDLFKLHPGGGHGDAATHRAALGDAYADYFSFGFVRNPWDRMISIRSFHKNRPHDTFYHVSNNGTVGEFLDALQERGFRQQIDYLSDPETKELIVSRVGRFERLAEDFNEICASLGLAAQLPHKNASKHDDYRRYYSDKDRETVQRICDRDIAAFGYRFDPD